MKTSTYQIKEVASLAGISTRTLRHYDQLGLLTPSVRSTAGYRLYTDADLLRLQQIMIGRSLGLALEDIRRSIDDPNLDRKQLLRQQRAELVARAQATASMIQAIDAAISLLDQECTKEISTVDMKQIFDGFDPTQYAAETEQRWGTTDSYKESTRRTRNYTKDDWQNIKQESNDILKDAVALQQANTSPSDSPSMEIAERYRLWVDRWFYPCSRSVHAKLADSYEGDARFAQYFDDLSPGLSSFIAAACHANSQHPQD